MTPVNSMRALQLVAPGTLKQMVLPVPHPREDEILVRTVATTICTSDLNDIAHNPFGIGLPRVLGHEGAGMVQAIGEGVENFVVGDPVAAHPVIPCRQCENCQRGLGHLCTQMGHLGLDRDGTFAEYFCIRADRARRVSNQVLPFACLLEPVAVCLEAVQRGRVQNGNNVLVVGDGPFGIIMARLAGRFEPNRLIVVGRHDFRLRQVPGAIALNEQRSSSASITEGVAEILKLNDGFGLDVALMAAGTQSALDLCVGALRARGRAVIFSAIAGRPSVDLFRVHTHELEILGACNDQNLIDPALASLNEPDLQLSSLITHRVPFDDWPRAFDLARGRKDEALKVALTFDV